MSGMLLPLCCRTDTIVLYPLLCICPCLCKHAFDLALMLQFERTLIVAEEDSFISYLEGCTAPSYDKNQVGKLGFLQ